MPVVDEVNPPEPRLALGRCDLGPGGAELGFGVDCDRVPLAVTGVAKSAEATSAAAGILLILRLLPWSTVRTLLPRQYPPVVNGCQTRAVAGGEGVQTARSPLRERVG